MDLAPEHRSRVTAYIKEVDAHLEELPSRTRRRLAETLLQRIEMQLRRLNDGISAADLDSLLNAFGKPNEQAAQLLRKERISLPGVRDGSDRRWLGVCAAIAERLEVEPAFVRGIALVLGLLSLFLLYAGVPLLPVLLLAYLGAFVVFQLMAPPEERLPVQPWPILRAVFLTFALVLTLHFGFGFLLTLIHYTHQRLAGEPIPSDLHWGWIEVRRQKLLAWALFSALPIAILGALPLARNWDVTLRKVAQAAVALYALVLCFGTASLLAGITLRLVAEYSGVAPLDIVNNVLESIWSLDLSNQAVLMRNFAVFIFYSPPRFVLYFI